MSSYRRPGIAAPPEHLDNCPDFLRRYLEYRYTFQGVAVSTALDTFLNLREMLQFFHFIEVEHHTPSTADAHKDLDISLMAIQELEKISDAAMVGYLNFLEIVVHNRKGTINKKLAHFRRFFSYIDQFGPELGLSAAYRVPRASLKAFRQDPTALQCVPPSKIAAFLNACGGETEMQDRAIFLMLARVPLDITRLLDLNREDFDGDGVWLHLENQPSRKIPLPSECVTALREYLFWLDDQMVDVEPSNRPRGLFVTKYGYWKRMTPRSIQRRIARTSARAGLPPGEVTALALRESAVYNLLQASWTTRQNAIDLLAYLGYKEPYQILWKFRTASMAGTENAIRAAFQKMDFAGLEDLKEE